MTLPLNRYIDHTLLKLDAKKEDIIQLCEEAKEYQFYSVCIRKEWLPTAVPLLQSSPVIPITVVGFHTGTDLTADKVKETIQAISLGACEIDMVLNRNFLFEKNYTALFHDIQSVVMVANQKPVKVILETSELSTEQKIISCAISVAAGAHYVKTSTGFSSSGATTEDITLMRKIVGPHIGVKASGGVRSLEDAMKMIQAGATRLGTSASVAIMKNQTAKGSY